MHGNGIFDGDADIEQTKLEEYGRVCWNRYGRRGIDREEIRVGPVTVNCMNHETGEKYQALVRATDGDEFGPCDFQFSVDRGHTWWPTVRLARSTVAA